VSTVIDDVHDSINGAGSFRLNVLSRAGIHQANLLMPIGKATSLARRRCRPHAEACGGTLRAHTLHPENAR
jgi:hypothetical protein